MVWHILLVEDDPDIRRRLIDGLRLASLEVTAMGDGQSALDSIGREGLPHLAVIDIALPDMDGLEVARHFWQRGTPVIIITDDAPGIAIKSLQWSEDFVREPFAPEELAARIRRVLDRIADYSYAGSPVVEIDERVKIDYVNNDLIVAGKPIRLTPIESQLLHTFMWHKGKVVDSRTLLLRGWPYGEAYEDTLRVHIHRLRTKLEADTRNPRYIVSERGVGYSLQVV